MADAIDSGSIVRNDVLVQVQSGAPKIDNSPGRVVDFTFLDFYYLPKNCKFSGSNKQYRIINQGKF